PGRLDDAGGLLEVAAAGEEPAGDAGGRNEVGCELDRLQHALGGQFRLAGLALARDGREEDGPLTAGTRLVDQAQGGAPLDGLQGGGPIAVRALRLEQRLVGPG